MLKPRMKRMKDGDRDMYSYLKKKQEIKNSR